jgi:hypothetical protein
VVLFDENIKKHIGKNLLILGLDLDPDPELDPDPHSSKSLDPDPHMMNADTKHCKNFLETNRKFNSKNFTEINLPQRSASSRRGPQSAGRRRWAAPCSCSRPNTDHSTHS